MISVHKPGLMHIYQVYLVNVEIDQVLQTLSYSLIYNRQAKCTKIRETYPPLRFKEGNVITYTRFLGFSLVPA